MYSGRIDDTLEYVVSLAHHYNIDAIKEPHLLWIPRVLMNLPLPFHWVKVNNQTFLNINCNNS
jgi:hypothetical protein